MEGARRAYPTVVVLAAFLLSALVPGTLAAPVAAGVPPLPSAVYTAFLTELAVPVAAPGSTVTLQGLLSNPLSDPINAVNLTFQLYEFNGYPGNGTGPLPSAGNPTFVSPHASGSVEWFDEVALAPGASVSVAATIAVPSGAAAGDYAVRTGLEFASNGTTYLLESRGYFSYAEWTNATTLPGGGSTLNVSRLGVSGILPETAISVQSSPFPIVLAALLGGALVLAGAGAYYAVRRGPGSRSGAR